MKTALFSVLAFGACASVAFAEPLPPASGAKDSAAAMAHPAGPVALTEAEMDKVAAGGVSIQSRLRLVAQPEAAARPTISPEWTDFSVQDPASL